MPNSSFIPKNNQINRPKVRKRYNLFFISVIVYGVFIAAPIASAAVYIYERHTNNIINQITQDLDTAIRSFDESDLLTVQQFDRRLQAGQQILDTNVPTHTLVSLLLQTTPQTVAFTGVELVSDGSFVTVIAEVVSESFDHVLFYRDELLQNEVFSNSVISDISYQGTIPQDDEETPASADAEAETESKLTYSVTFVVPVSYFATLPQESVASADLMTDTESTNSMEGDESFETESSDFERDFGDVEPLETIEEQI